MNCGCELCVLIRAMPKGATLEADESMSGEKEYWYRLPCGGVSVGDTPEEAINRIDRMRAGK